MNPLQPNEQAPWTVKYINLVVGDVLDVLEKQASQLPDFLGALVPLENRAYAPGKWTIKELLGHLIDTERILVFRMLTFAREDSQPLPGFDEDNYVIAADFHKRDFVEMIAEFRLLRLANLHFFKSLSEEQLNQKGSSSGNISSARSLLYVCAGHIIHHVNVIEERYL